MTIKNCFCKCLLTKLIHGNLTLFLFIFYLIYQNVTKDYRVRNVQKCIYVHLTGCIQNVSWLIRYGRFRNSTTKRKVWKHFYISLIHQKQEVLISDHQHKTVVASVLSGLFVPDHWLKVWLKNTLALAE